MSKRKTKQQEGRESSTVVVDQPDPMVGERVGDRYEIEALLGVGGMGRVYRAFHAELEREVAVKLMHPELCADRRRVERFRREALATSRLSHPCSVTVYDFGEWEGMLYLVMELISGRPLGLEMHRNLPFDAELTVALLSQVCDALEAAHEAKVVHRDLKPENVMLLDGPEVVVEGFSCPRLKVVDFGLALLLDDGRDRLTKEGAAAGTPIYMSPEQCRGELVDHRSDIYSLGIMLYELLCGEAPFDAPAPQEILMQHLLREPTPPSERNPEAGVHSAFDAVALWALGKEPESRPQSAAVLREEMQTALAISRGEVQPSSARKASIVNADRRARAVAYGLPEREGESAPSGIDLAAIEIAVLEAESVSFSRSVTACLRAARAAVQTVTSLEAPLGAGVVALVVDVRDDAGAGLDRLAAHMQGGRGGGGAGAIEKPPVVVVGPDDSVEPMARALELGVDHYVPASQMAVKLPKAVKRAARRYAKRKG
ncbi:MAG: serine/threonine protein kinase [Myxococcales bacterium]|nr:serine/threonine protein kinase [Myxococcales bacterium]